ncbi:hypothetical protein SDC9_168350 [bioreactor metagenome]|uniref:Uncharacterized protein n=1 Tax=bioreactor metagenome TaxID=1076179 RepID=A0A645G2A8_9ZZZZ
MEIAKPGNIKTFCQPNALITLQEYINDYADEEIKTKGNQLIDSVIELLPEQEKRITKKMIDDINSGTRDIYL